MLLGFRRIREGSEVTEFGIRKIPLVPGRCIAKCALHQPCRSAMSPDHLETTSSFNPSSFLYTWKLTPWVLLPRASCRMEMQILHERRQGPRSQGGGDLLSDLARAKSDFCSSRHRFPPNSAEVSGARPSKEGRSPMFSALTSWLQGQDADTSFIRDLMIS